MSKRKIVILDGYPLNPGDLNWDNIATHGELKVYDHTPPNKIVERIADAEIIFSNKTPITRDTLNKTHIKYIGLFSTGYNIIDTVAAREHGILVTNVPSYSSAAVAQFTFALLLELCHHVQNHSDSVFNGDWANSKHFCFWKYPQIELANNTLGLIGFGDISQRVAKIAFALDMKVLVYTRTPKPEIEDVNLKFVNFETLCKYADVISVHCPLFDQTKNLINKTNLALMKPSAFVINTARGAIVNEQDMYDALVNKTIAGFACDVVSEEPMPKTNPLMNAPNCIITPHIAWVPLETRKRLLSIVEKNLECFLAGKPQNIVNF